VSDTSFYKPLVELDFDLSDIDPERTGQFSRGLIFQRKNYNNMIVIID